MDIKSTCLSLIWHSRKDLIKDLQLIGANPEANFKWNEEEYKSLIILKKNKNKLACQYLHIESTFYP